MRGSFILSGLLASILAQSAQAADMTDAEIKELISGNTIYIETVSGAASGTGQGVIYYAPDGKATFKTPAGPIWDGSWTIKDNTACVDWKQMPNNPCTRYDRQGETVTLINMATGKPRAKIVRSAKGNPEKL